MLLKCEQVSPLLSEYIDGELKLWKEQMVKFHLKICPKCSQELEEICKTDKFLKLGMEEVFPSENFTEDILAKVSVISRKEHDNLSLFQHLVGKIKTYAIWFRYNWQYKIHLSFAWKASLTTILLVILFGFLSWFPFNRSDLRKEQSSVFVQKNEKIINFIKVEFVQPNTGRIYE